MLGMSGIWLQPHYRNHVARLYERALLIVLLLSSTDSDLEAFSHNPTDDSFAPLAVQPRAITKYPT